MTSFRSRIGIVAIFKNERPYVVEWVAHHRVVGIDSFYVADNDSDDGTTELLRALEGLGLVRTFPFPSPPGEAPQFPAYEFLLRGPAAEEEWVAVVDADEFLVPEEVGATLTEALAPVLDRPEVGAVAVNWAVYGSSWRMNKTTGLVLERFTRRALDTFGPNLHYKSILRVKALEAVLKNPHHFQLKTGFEYVRPTGERLELHPRHGAGLSATLDWRGARVNHYLVKSREEFEQNKRPKGRATMVGGTKGEKYFEGHNRNDVSDPARKGHLEAVQAEVRRIEGLLVDQGHELSREEGTAPVFDRPFEGVRAVVDRIEQVDNVVRVSGWAMHWSGLPPVSLAVEIRGRRSLFLGYEHRKRQDVTRVFPMASSHCGFEVSVPVTDPVDDPREVRVFVGLDEGTPYGPFSRSTWRP